MDAPKQNRRCAQCQAITLKVDQTLLVNTNPVGKQAELPMMDDFVSVEVIPPAIGDVGLLGLRFFLWRPAEKIVDAKLQAVRTHDCYEYVSVLVVHDVSCSILTERVADLTIDEAPVFPRYESPRANERIRCHSLLLQRQYLRFLQSPAIDRRC